MTHDIHILFQLETCDILDTKIPMGNLDSHNLLVKSKGNVHIFFVINHCYVCVSKISNNLYYISILYIAEKLEEITNHIPAYDPIQDDDQASVKVT